MDASAITLNPDYSPCVRPADRYSGGPREMKRLALIVLLAFPAPTMAAEIVGSVARVADGDTFTIGKTRIRLCGIQAPERGRRGAKAATAELSRIVAGRTIRCVPVGEGTPCDGRSPAHSFDRVVAQCFAGRTDVAGALAASGTVDDWSKFSGGFYQRSPR